MRRGDGVLNWSYVFQVLYSELSTEQTLSFSEASLQEVHSCDPSAQLGGIIQLCERYKPRKPRVS